MAAPLEPVSATAAQGPLPHRWVMRTAAILMGVLLSLGAAELLLRAAGATPARPVIALPNEPRLLIPDPELGWRPATGRHVFAPYTARGSSASVTILPDGSRDTGARDHGSAGTLLLVGCSFTQGWAISDDETFAWRVQQRFPELRVINRGVGAYGTYQALLVMERALAAPAPPGLILYGMMEEHEPRNVAAAPWLTLLAMAAKRDVVAVPYCTLEDGRVVRHPPTEYPRWPLRGHSALVAQLERWWLERRAGGRAASQRAVTEALLLEMHRTAAAHGSRFGVILLHFTPAAKAHYLEFLERHGIDAIDCAYEIEPGLRVPGDSHPNGAMNARYAECIAAGLAAKPDIFTSMRAPAPGA